MSESAVFFDPSRKRWWWVKRIVSVVGLLSVIVSSIFLLSILTAPLLPDMPGVTSAIKRAVRSSMHIPRRQTKRLQFILRRDREKLDTEILRERKTKSARIAVTAKTKVNAA